MSDGGQFGLTSVTPLSTLCGVQWYITSYLISYSCPCKICFSCYQRLMMAPDIELTEIRPIVNFVYFYLLFEKEIPSRVWFFRRNMAIIIISIRMPLYRLHQRPSTYTWPFFLQSKCLCPLCLAAPTGFQRACFKLNISLQCCCFA